MNLLPKFDLSSLPKETREIIGMLLVIFLVTVVPIASITVLRGLISGDLFGSKCWDVQKIDGKLYKVDKCSGKVIELDPNRIQKE